MNSQEFKSLGLRMAAMVDELDNRSQQAVHTMEAGARLMRQTSSDWERHAQQVSQMVLSGLRSQSRLVIEEGTGQALEQCNARVRELVGEATRSVHELQHQRATLRAHSRSVLWVGSVALVLGSLLAAGGCIYVAWDRQQALEQVRFSEDILQATRDGRLTWCGKQLCARVGTASQRYGEKGDFALIR